MGQVPKTAYLRYTLTHFPSYVEDEFQIVGGMACMCLISLDAYRQNGFLRLPVEGAGVTNWFAKLTSANDTTHDFS